jgi:hypothetical protein
VKRNWNYIWTDLKTIFSRGQHNCLLKTINNVLMPFSRKDFLKLACDLAEDILAFSTVKKQTAGRGFLPVHEQISSDICVKCIIHNYNNSSCLVGY